MKLIFRHFLYYSHKQQKGILTLAIIILTTVLYPTLHRQHISPTLPIISDTLYRHRQNEVMDFMASVQKKATGKRQSTTTYRKEKPASERVDASLFEFDPNQADSLIFRKLGLPAWMTHNILKYRKKGGQFHKKEDFKKIYGLKEELYAVLSPYIKIAPNTPAPAQHSPALLAITTDSLRQPFIEKYPPGTVIELNSADTTELQKIPGIGSGIAHKIAHYRKRLGGFYRIEQLEEIHIRYQLLKPWFHIDKSLIERIPVNRVSVERLRRHPYINFYQARALVEHRKKSGVINSLKPFILMEEFTETDLQRIKPYLDFSVTQNPKQPHTDSPLHKGQ